MNIIESLATIPIRTKGGMEPVIGGGINLEVGRGRHWGKMQEETTGKLTWILYQEHNPSR